MSAATLFRSGGDLYDCIPRIIDELPPGDRHAATTVFRHLIRQELDGRLDERVTDQTIADAIGYSTRFVQKGLHSLHVKLGQLGKAIIDRIPCHGRRVITFVRGLAARRDAPPKPTPAPPQTPPEEIKIQTTTDTPPSSSSPEIIIPEPEPDDPAIADLIGRACRLIGDATAERVGVTIASYGAGWVGLALDQVEKRNRAPGKLPVWSWRFVLGILANWRREGGPPAPSEAAPAPPPRRPSAEPAAPPQRLSAEEVAELLARCTSSDRMTAQFGRVSLRLALREGTIGAEELARIPEELRGAAAGPEVPAGGPGS